MVTRYIRLFEVDLGPTTISKEMPVTRRGNPPVVKRTVYIDGRNNHSRRFVLRLKEIAQTQGVRVSEVVTEVERSRQGGNPPQTRPRPFKKSRVYRRGKRQAVERRLRE